MFIFQLAHRLLTVSGCNVQQGPTIAVGGATMTEDISRRLSDFYRMEDIQIEFAKVCTVKLSSTHFKQRVRKCYLSLTREWA